MKLAKQELNIISDLSGQSGIANDPAKLRRLKNRTEMIASHQEIILLMRLNKNLRKQK